MLRTALWTLRQPRYKALAALMLVIAVICIGMGTFELHRYSEKTHDNDQLTSNAHAAPVPLTSALVAVTGAGPGPAKYAIRYRTVTASGTYLPGAQTFLTNVSQGSNEGFDVITPLRTSAGILLVARGFVVADAAGTPPVIAPPPTGPVRLRGRLASASASPDRLATLGHSVVASVNPAEQSARLGAPVFQAYLSLDAHQAGTGGLRALPAPALSNPTGGAGEGQLFSYIIQWYIFALLAIAAPFAMGRHEVAEARRTYLGIDPAREQFDLAAIEDAADGRAQLAAGGGADVPGGADAGGALAVREAGELSRREEISEPEWQRAAQLADRYGRSLGREGDPARGSRRSASLPGLRPRRTVVTNSATDAHRSDDDTYHGSYNDYLWELALADGRVPTGAADGAPSEDPPDPARPTPDRPAGEPG